MGRLKAAFPKRDPMELQDILRSHDLSLEAALKALAHHTPTASRQAPQTSPKGKVQVISTVLLTYSVAMFFTSV